VSSGGRRIRGFDVNRIDRRAAVEERIVREDGACFKNRVKIKITNAGKRRHFNGLK